MESTAGPEPARTITTDSNPFPEPLGHVDIIC